MSDLLNKPTSRRSALGLLFGGILAATATLAMTEIAEAKPGKGRGWGRGGGRYGGRPGNPPGWSRGRKRGWAKRGGPKWRW